MSLNSFANCKADNNYNAIVVKITNKLDSLDDTCDWLAKITIDIEECVMSPLVGGAISEEWKSIAHNWERTCRETDEKCYKLLNESNILKKRICDLEKMARIIKRWTAGNLACEIDKILLNSYITWTDSEMDIFHGDNF